MKLKESAQPFVWAADNRAMTAQRRNSPHDKLFKAVFSEPANAVAHFAVCVPPELVAALDLSKAQHVRGSWVDEALRDRHSDVVHSIPLRGTGATDGQTESVLLHTIWEHLCGAQHKCSYAESGVMRSRVVLAD
jgi:hypothetical protein